MVWVSFVVLVVGLVILIYSSEKTVGYLVKLAAFLGFSTFTIGFLIASIGSDLPEIVNSVFSAYLGHGDISLGDSIGSVLTQITLVLGLLPFFCKFCRLIPRTFAIVGLAEVSVLGLAVFLAKDGAVGRIDGLLLVAAWAVSMVVLRKLGGQGLAAETCEDVICDDDPRKLAFFTLLGFAGIAIGSYAVIQSVITISSALGISEFIVSFFMVSLGTSLPELMVEIAAIRSRHYELALGDIIGSCLVDASLAIGLGPIFFPISVSGGNIFVTGMYALFASIVIISILTWRGVNDRRTGLFFILIYFGSFLTTFFLQ
jgi:cation:H+ antiporter